VSFDLELTGRRALVTAGTRGIGAAVVDVLRNAGAIAVATARAIPTEAPVARQYVGAHFSG
jgi:NAD(P)-dependent dehydrogenase (short-subunit alcohol dehydrogenase family)